MRLMGKIYSKIMFLNVKIGFLLPNINLPNWPYMIYFEFGLSSLASDGDNLIKTAQQLSRAKKYGFNDKLIKGG